MLREILRRRQQQAQEKAPAQTAPSIDMQRVDCLILSGGQGTRLFPLTQSRCKPAVPFGGYYRLIDVALSNALHARCRKIYVITQFLSSSLHQHIYRTYAPQNTGADAIDILTAEQRPDSQLWYQGTADAVRQNLPYLLESKADYFLILSGDQLYNIDFTQMLRFAQKTDADLVIASLPVDESSAKRLGVLKTNEKFLVKDFCEKPQDPAILRRFVCPNRIIETLTPGNDAPLYLGSMGIYLFKRQALLHLLSADPREDFGKHLIPSQVVKGKCYAYLYDGYWEDIGTISSYYNTNIALTRPEPAFSCYSDNLTLFAARPSLPPSKIHHAQVHQSILCDGTVVEGAEVHNSILGPRTIVRRGSTIRDSYIIGNDSYLPRQSQQLQIGRNCHIRQAILDMNVTLGDNVVLTNTEKLTNYDGNGIYIREGIIIVTKGTVLPDSFTL